MSNQKVIPLAHHEQHELCQTRPLYRQGRKLTAVKVYTINDESKHLIVSGVPKLQLKAEVKKLFCPYGNLKKFLPLPDYPGEQFTESYHVHFDRIQSARIAKRFVDGKNFFGGSLHVFYTPELETISETREKLAQRRKDVAVRIKRHKEDPTNPRIDQFIPVEQFDRKKKRPALPLTDERLAKKFPGETLNTIYEKIPQEIDPRFSTLPSSSYATNTSTSNSNFFQAPYKPNETVISTTSKLPPEIVEKKVKNYKGRTVKITESKRFGKKIFRPEIVDTRNLANFEEQGEGKKSFVNPKKVEKGIVIKMLPEADRAKKRIIIMDSSVTEIVKPSENLGNSIKSARERIREAMSMEGKNKNS